MKNTQDFRAITVIHEGDFAILCEQGHFKLSTWRLLVGQSGRRLRKPRLYPWGNWQLFESSARAWLQRLGITLQEGECALLPPGLTLKEFG